jgi:hypothetical protein
MIRKFVFADHNSRNITLRYALIAGIAAGLFVLGIVSVVFMNDGNQSGKDFLGLGAPIRHSLAWGALAAQVVMATIFLYVWEHWYVHDPARGPSGARTTMSRLAWFALALGMIALYAKGGPTGAAIAVAMLAAGVAATALTCVLLKPHVYIGMAACGPIGLGFSVALGGTSHGGDGKGWLYFWLTLALAFAIGKAATLIPAVRTFGDELLAVQD